MQVWETVTLFSLVCANFSRAVSTKSITVGWDWNSNKPTLAGPASFSAKQPRMAVVFKCLAEWHTSWCATALLIFNISVNFWNASFIGNGHSSSIHGTPVPVKGAVWGRYIIFTDIL
uniref:Uncharacterized protein n=1 Tax=Anolis carolinensis TaxID=28377 RepID=A0A803SWA3_ANOCA